MLSWAKPLSGLDDAKAVGLLWLFLLSGVVLAAVLLVMPA